MSAVTAGAELDRAGLVLGLTMVWSVQLTAQYANEYFDRLADRAVEHRTWFSGGSGVLPTGRLDPAVAMVAAAAATAIALGVIATMAGRVPLAAVVGLVALAGSWAYSAPPLRLVGTAGGDPVVTIIVAGLVPLTGAIVQGRVSSLLWMVVGVLVPFHLAMLIAFALPDVNSDARAGKHSLAVRLGVKAAGRLHLLYVAIGTATMAGVVLTDPRLLGATVALPAAWAQAVGASRQRWGLLTAAAAATVSLVAVGAAGSMLLAQ